MPVAIKYLFLCGEGQTVSKYVYNLLGMIIYKEKLVRKIENEWVELIWRIVREGSNKMTVIIDLNEVSE